MALKDLAASRASINESVIEDIVGTFARYDLNDRAIVLMSAISSLTVRQKILVYLTANEGWCYLDPSLQPIPASPKSLEDPLGISGGTIRGRLSELVRV